MNTIRLSGLYAITDAGLMPDREALLSGVQAAILGGAALIQYRDKSADADRRLAEASALNSLCRKLGVLFIVNDDVALAAESGAHGVHLGQADGSILEARLWLGNEAIIGATCHASLELAERATLEGASYLAFGRFFDSQTKPGAPAATPELLHAARRFGLPRVAIGGVTPDNGATLLAAGADMLAAVHGVFGQAHVMAAAQAYAHLFEAQ